VSRRECRWPGCGKTVPASYWGCLVHWKLVPREIRERINAAYRASAHHPPESSPEFAQAAAEASRWARARWAERSRRLREDLDFGKGTGDDRVRATENGE
jgi:hypothetical protein